MPSLPVRVEIDAEDRHRVDRALDIADRFVKVLEKLANLLKGETK